MINDKAMMNLEDVTGLADIMIASGYFKGVKDVAQAAVKILAGRELGIPPVAALRGLDIVEGNISIRAHLMAAMIKSSGKYNYIIRVSTNETCEIDFIENTIDIGYAVIGSYTFGMEDAKRAGLASRGPWKQYPKMMLYNRCMSMGCKVYCADIFLGAIYEEGEIDTSQGAHSRELQNIVERDLDQSQENTNKTEPPPESWSPSGPEMTNLFGVEKTATMSPQMEAPEPENQPNNSAPSSKQIGYLCSLLKSHGVLDGDKKNLIETVLGNDPNKTVVSSAIESLLNLNDDGLPTEWINPYIKSLRKRHKITAKTVVAYLNTVFNITKPGDLSKAQQIRLIEWLINDDLPGMSPATTDESIPTTVTQDLSSKKDELDKNDEKPEEKEIYEQLEGTQKEWILFVDKLYQTTGIEPQFIESWLCARCNPLPIELIDGSAADLKRFTEADIESLAFSIRIAWSKAEENTD